MTNESTPKNNKTKSLLFMGLILLFGIVIGGYFVLESNSIEATKNSNTTVNITKTAGEDSFTLFISPNLGYSVRVPAGWYTDSFSRMNGGLDERGKDYDYIMNELVKAPLEMTSRGVSIHVEVLRKEGRSLQEVAAERSKEKSVSQQREFVISGLTTLQQYEDNRPEYDANYGYSLVIYIEAGENIYEFAALSTAPEARRDNESIIMSIVGSFQLR